MVLHIRRVPQRSKEDLDEAYDLPGVKIELTGRLFVQERIVKLGSNK